MTLLYRRLQPTITANEWVPPAPQSDLRAQAMRISPGRGLCAESRELKGAHMNNDDRDLLQILESELDFLNKGGYHRSVRTPRESTICFQDSPVCPEYPCRTHNDQCLLMQFVPQGERSSAVPCHHIPLNDKGDTVESLVSEDSQGAQEALRTWLQRAIDNLKQKQDGSQVVS